jgi:UrcA family protein
MLKTMIRTLALAAAVLASVPAMAADRTADVRVYYGDLDLSNPAAIRTLDRRLGSAVNSVCPDDNGVGDLSRLRAIALCRAAKSAEVAPLRAAALASAANGRATAVAAR